MLATPHHPSHTYQGVHKTNEEVHMRYFVAAFGLLLALAFGQVASAAGNTGWDSSSNGNGYYHVGNG